VNRESLTSKGRTIINPTMITRQKRSEKIHQSRVIKEKEIVSLEI